MTEINFLNQTQILFLMLGASALKFWLFCHKTSTHLFLFYNSFYSYNFNKVINKYEILENTTPIVN